MQRQNVPKFYQKCDKVQKVNEMQPHKGRISATGLPRNLPLSSVLLRA